MENRFRGIRIFFQDCVGNMTKLHKNRDYKECLTKLRQIHYQKILKDKIEQDFQNIVFHDIIDKNTTFSSLIIGFNFPYFMEGKKLICQKLFRYISTQIQIWLALFIQFPNTKECLQLAYQLVNITNDAKKTNFYCSSQVFLGVSSVGIIGHPQDLITLIDEHLSCYHEFDKSQEFIQGLKIGILEKNFCHTITIEDQKNLFDSTEKILEKKPELELKSQEQLKLIKINKNINFKNYCKLLKFICQQKQKLSSEQTEAELSLELEYISQKLTIPKGDLNFFSIIQNQICYEKKFSQKQEQEIQQNLNRSRNLEDHPNYLQQSQKQSSTQSKKSTDDQNQSSNKKSQNEVSLNTDLEGAKDFIMNRDEIIKIDQQDQIFQSPIIKQLKEQNQRFVISPEYKDYFQKLIGQYINLSVNYEQNEKINNYFICLDKDEVFKIKCFKKNIKIFEKLQDAKQFCLGKKNMKIIEVMVNQHAEKDNQIYEVNEMNDSYFYTTQDNQIYPIRQME